MSKTVQYWLIGILSVILAAMVVLTAAVLMFVNLLLNF